MNLKDAHTENKPVQTTMLFSATEGKVISLQIVAGEQLKEHLSKVPALLVCVSGNAVYKDENDSVINLKSGDYINIPADVQHRINAVEESNFLLIK